MKRAFATIISRFKPTPNDEQRRRTKPCPHCNGTGRQINMLLPNLEGPCPYCGGVKRINY